MSALGRPGRYRDLRFLSICAAISHIRDRAVEHAEAGCAALPPPIAAVGIGRIARPAPRGGPGPSRSPRFERGSVGNAEQNSPTASSRACGDESAARGDVRRTLLAGARRCHALRAIIHAPSRPKSRATAAGTLEWEISHDALVRPARSTSQVVAQWSFLAISQAPSSSRGCRGGVRDPPARAAEPERLGSRGIRASCTRRRAASAATS